MSSSSSSTKAQTPVRDDIIDKLKEQYELERSSLDGLQQCVDFLKTRFVDRETVFKMLSLLPGYPVRDAAFHFAFEVDDDDKSLLEALKEIVSTLKTSMELKISMILPYM